MKKLTLLILATILILGTAACGSKETALLYNEPATADTAGDRAAFEAASDYVKSAIGTSLVPSSVQDDEDGLTQYWSYNGDEANDKINLSVTIAGKSITLGKTSVSDLENLGFELDLKNETVNPNTVFGFTVTKNGKHCNLGAVNNTREAMKLSEMTVTQFNALSNDFNMDYDYNGITTGSTLEDVIKAFGTPKNSITLSSDHGAPTITLSYAASVTEESTAISDTLDITLVYNSANKTASLTNINLNHNEEAVSKK